MLKIQRVNSSSKLGAVISNINISDKLSNADIKYIKKLWNEVYVLVFPNQILEHSQFENFSLIFGEFGEDPFIKSIKDHPNIIEVKRTAMERHPILVGLGTLIGHFKKPHHQQHYCILKSYRQKEVIHSSLIR